MVADRLSVLPPVVEKISYTSRVDIGGICATPVSVSEAFNNKFPKLTNERCNRLENFRSPPSSGTTSRSNRSHPAELTRRSFTVLPRIPMLEVEKDVSATPYSVPSLESAYLVRTNERLNEPYPPFFSAFAVRRKQETRCLAKSAATRQSQHSLIVFELL